MSKVSGFGWIGKKIGMSNVKYHGAVIAVTLVEIGTQHILLKKKDGDRYVLKVGVELKRPKLKPQIEELKKIGHPMCGVVKEFSVLQGEYEAVEGAYGVETFASVPFIDVTAKNIGKGFAGGMKRWNFQGAGASHGTSLTHRAIGSTGTREKNWPGKKMPGRLGGAKVTVQSLPVVEFDTDLNLVVLHGSVPGKVGEVVVLKKAVKRPCVGVLS